MNRTQRNYAIAGSVLLFHAAALWALQSGLVRRVVEVVVPVQMISELLTPPSPIEPKPVPPPPAVVPKLQPQPRQKAALPPAPQPVARADAPATPNAPVGSTEPQPPAPPMAVAVAPSPAPAPYVPPTPLPPPPPPKIELPSSDASYLQNPKPAYPALSKRMGEQGKVMVRALIGADGTVQRAEIGSSSGFERLDQAALAAVRQWRFVPGKRGGVPEAMSHNIPVNFVLE